MQQSMVAPSIACTTEESIILKVGTIDKIHFYSYLAGGRSFDKFYKRQISCKLIIVALKKLYQKSTPLQAKIAYESGDLSMVQPLYLHYKKS